MTAKRCGAAPHLLLLALAAALPRPSLLAEATALGMNLGNVLEEPFERPPPHDAACAGLTNSRCAPSDRIAEHMCHHVAAHLGLGGTPERSRARKQLQPTLVMAGVGVRTS